ncbi:VOC family protein [Luteimonas sp. 22616]|jgi:catechol 2,3-dioxygenase-like lactoylglutathione lyase family enzyme|uniref:VOC family protein n=1 Tax=Luteimonas sp. 22616 TaxID=3453951 RepID=UPI003F85D196
MVGDAPDSVGGQGYAQGIVEVVGPDLDRSITFYLSIGFELLRRTDGFAVVHWQGQRLFLAENVHAPVAPRWTNLRIMVDDVDALWRRTTALGITPMHPIGDRFYGLRDFTLADPSGFEIRFAQALS